MVPLGLRVSLDYQGFLYVLLQSFKFILMFFLFSFTMFLVSILVLLLCITCLEHHNYNIVFFIAFSMFT